MSDNPETSHAVVKTIEKLAPLPGEVVVVNVDRPLSEEMLIVMRNAIKSILENAGHPDTAVIVVEPGITIEVAEAKLEHATRHVKEYQLEELEKAVKKVDSLTKAVNYIAELALHSISTAIYSEDGLDGEAGQQTMGIIQSLLESAGLPQIMASGEVII